MGRVTLCGLHSASSLGLQGILGGQTWKSRLYDLGSRVQEETLGKLGQGACGFYDSPAQLA